jgi:membrane-bound serine protease (ClpP class)
MMRAGARYLLAAIAVLASVGLALAQSPTSPTAPSVEADPATASTAPWGDRAAIIVLKSNIDDYTRDTLFKRFEEARELGAATVVLQLNTPGGLVTAGLDISRFLKRQDDLHVVVYVDEQALSAGAMIALAADEIVMGPGSMMGDCAPITFGPGGLQTLGDAERAKAESPILTDFRDSALKNGYDPLLAESMVSYGRVVHYVQNAETGERRFVNAEEYERLTADGAWKPVEGVKDPVDAADTLLTVGPADAVKLGLATGTAPSATALAAERGLDVVTTLAPSKGDQVVALLASMEVRSLLMTIFLFTLYMAFSHPGHGMPEVAAMVTLGALVGVPLLTGYAQWWEILAVLVGLGLVAVEIFILPGFGFAGISGVLLTLFGLTMTFVGDEPVELPGLLPSLAGTWTALWNGVVVVTVGLAASLLLWVWLSRYLPKLPYVNRLILSGTTGGPGAVAAPGGAVVTSDVPSDGPVVGEMGLTVTDLRPSGSVRFEGDGLVVSVISDTGYVPRGSKVVVFDTTENRIVVRPVAS